MTEVVQGAEREALGLGLPEKGLEVCFLKERRSDKS